MNSTTHSKSRDSRAVEVNHDITMSPSKSRDSRAVEVKHNHSLPHASPGTQTPGLKSHDLLQRWHHTGEICNFAGNMKDLLLKKMAPRREICNFGGEIKATSWQLTAFGCNSQSPCRGDLARGVRCCGTLNPSLLWME